MNFHKILSLVAAAGLLAACASTSSSSHIAPAPTPTPDSQPIAVLNADQLPASYTVVGTIKGYTIEMLQKKARKLGADAIINPTSVDPVSGWATTEAIKYKK
jgi:ABC-type amino acid transport substrate-binding protein